RHGGGRLDLRQGVAPPTIAIGRRVIPSISLACAAGSQAIQFSSLPKKSPGFRTRFSHVRLLPTRHREIAMPESGIFKSAVKLSAAERGAYLDKACGANAALRLEIESLLRAHDQPGEFLYRPPIADMTTDYRNGPERPGMRVGPYKLLQFLGEGGM